MWNVNIRWMLGLVPDVAHSDSWTFSNSCCGSLACLAEFVISVVTVRLIAGVVGQTYCWCTGSLLRFSNVEIFWILRRLERWLPFNSRCSADMHRMWLSNWNSAERRGFVGWQLLIIDLCMVMFRQQWSVLSCKTSMFCVKFTNT